jgi:oligopeptide/dipeptide ABC transporter ATP-binding protein
MSEIGQEILRVKDLQMYFPVRSRGLIPRVVGAVKAVDGVDLTLSAGETLGLVGESGSGKTTTGRAILRLIKPTAGSVQIDGQEIATLSESALMPLRRTAQMIFQDPYNALNPRHTVGAIISAPFKIQGVQPKGGVKAAVQELMERVGLNPEHYNRYPNEFSGGQRQRIGVARAIALRPKMIVCDEPVSALDVSIQAQIINLLRDLQDDYQIAYLFVAHDLAVVRQISHRVAVMYLGHIVEMAPQHTIYTAPQHPYTHSLLSAVPIPNPRLQRQRKRIVLQGDVPSPIDPPSGCVFRTRCFQAQDRCAAEVPPLVELEPGHFVACHFPIKEVPADVAVTTEQQVQEAAAATAVPKVPEAPMAPQTPAAVPPDASPDDTAAGDTATADTAPTQGAGPAS